MVDESCIYGYDPETNQQSSQWKSPQSLRARKAQQARSLFIVMKLEGQSFERVSDIPKELQVVLDSIKENDFHGALKHGKNGEITVYIPKETVLKEMAAKIFKLSQHFFFYLVQELSDMPHITHRKRKVPKLNTLERFHIYNITKKGLQMNDTFTDVYNTIFNILFKTYIHT
jgi:hypothetical protein